MKSKRLPSFPRTSVIIRSGVKGVSDESVMRQASRIARNCAYWKSLSLKERVISVPEDQMESFRFHTRVHRLEGFTFLPRPSGRNFGQDQEFNERSLVENPGQVVLVDSDFGFIIENPQASYKLTPEQWGAEFEDASCLAVHFGTRLWGFSYRQTQGGFTGRQGIHSSINSHDSGFARSTSNKKSVRGFFLRNLIVCSSTARGTWGNVPLLEDLYRSVSEYVADPSSLGRYYGTRVRFPDERTNRDYYQHPDWKTGKRIIERDFPSDVVSQFRDVFHRVHKTRK